MRLIRSKGVGVYFVTQNPLDVPETVLAQLGNRVQHALRAYTPREQKAVRTAADTFRPNPDFDCAKAITQLGVGEALVSTLEAKGVPSMVQRTLIRPPASRLGPITPQERQQVMAESPVAGQYDKTIDRESAFEMLQKKAAESRECRRTAEASRSSRPAPPRRQRRLRLVDPRLRHGQRRPQFRPADGRRGGDQVGRAFGRLVGRPRAGARHFGQPDPALKGYRISRSCRPGAATWPGRPKAAFRPAECWCPNRRRRRT